MSTIIRSANASDTDSICLLLHEKMNNRIPVDRWRNLMSYQWLKEKPDFGRVVESDGKVLGFCGMIYADRLIGDDPANLRTERIVSMSSWYLDKSLRGRGLGRDMLLSAISDPDLTYATLTNSRKPIAIVEALGFNKLEDHRYLWHKGKSAAADITIIENSSELLARVPSHQRQLLDDMRELPLTPMLLVCQKRQALLFFSIKSKGNNVTWYDLMYSSDQSLFSASAQSLANRLLPDTPSVLAADGRFVSDPSAEAIKKPLPVARYFISRRVHPHELDNLYSELQLLDLKLD